MDYRGGNIVATANLGFEEKLWQMADKLRGSMDSGEYKNVVLGLLFLKYVSDAFEEKYKELKEDEWADEEDRDEYIAENIFFVPKKHVGHLSRTMQESLRLDN